MPIRQLRRLRNMVMEGLLMGEVPAPNASRQGARKRQTAPASGSVPAIRSILPLVGPERHRYMTPMFAPPR
ncbi:MAG: hypothetical protein MUF54_15990, partial [Polyangiaceae bacterium]|nr:hypothetical protein [Polyangiaceae bacterium]